MIAVEVVAALVEVVVGSSSDKSFSSDDCKASIAVVISCGICSSSTCGSSSGSTNYDYCVHDEDDFLVPIRTNDVLKIKMMIITIMKYCW